MNDLDPDGLQSYLWWMIINNLIGSVRFNYNYDYNTGRNISITQMNYCAQVVNKHLGVFLSDAIAVPNFLKMIKPNMLNIFEDIRSIFNDMVENSDWMDKESKRALIAKSLAMKVNVGFAEFLLNQTKSDEIFKDLSFTENSLLENEYAMWRIRTNLSSMGDTDDEMPKLLPTEVNAVYYYKLNSLSKMAIFILSRTILLYSNCFHFSDCDGTFTVSILWIIWHGLGVST